MVLFGDFICHVIRGAIIRPSRSRELCRVVTLKNALRLQHILKNPDLLGLLKRTL
jgi:hypothetical protein